MNLPFEISFQDVAYKLESPRHCPASPTLRDVWNDLLGTLKCLVNAFFIKPAQQAFEAIRFYDNFILASIGRLDLVEKTVLKLSSDDAKGFRREARRTERTLKASYVEDWSEFSDDTPTIGDMVEWHRTSVGIAKNKFRRSKK